MKNRVDDNITSRNNYCLSCWIDFTTMTPEELANYQKMMEQAKESLVRKGMNNTVTYQRESSGHQGINVICNETQIIYKSISACARAIGSNVCTLSRHLAFKYPESIKGHTFSYI